MAFIEIPVAAVPYQRFSVQLDGVVYHLRVRYNTRSGVWTLDVLDAAQTPLVCGIAMRIGEDLLAQYADDRMPPGRLFVQNFLEEYAEPGRDDMGSDVLLIYREAA